ncbi:RNA polymerase-binding protein RbpA, partial [Acidipropionibacterium jensenii]
MADRALRGMGLGSKSFEDEEGVEMAERQEIGFDCPNGHHFEITFSVEA